MPWDAIICTSNCVLDTVNKILEAQKEFLSKRYSIQDCILPKLPVIPLAASMALGGYIVVIDPKMYIFFKSVR